MKKTATKKLYVLRASRNVGYDAYTGFIVRARSAQEARKEAQKITDQDQFGFGDDTIFKPKDTTWLDKNTSTCKPLSAERGKLGLVFSSFRHG